MQKHINSQLSVKNIVVTSSICHTFLKTSLSYIYKWNGMKMYCYYVILCDFITVLLSIVYCVLLCVYLYCINTAASA